MSCVLFLNCHIAQKADGEEQFEHAAAKLLCVSLICVMCTQHWGTFLPFYYQL